MARWERGKIMLSFGPVPSRRLGRSIGVNNIPPKVCTFACVYCQLGRTNQMQVERVAFYDPQEVFDDVADRVAAVRQAGERVDYLTFVPDGEPTLEIELAREMELARGLGIPVGVITNSSLLWRPDVREALSLADWVSVKVDAVREDLWRQIDRPHRRLELAAVLDGVREFAGAFAGELVSETMLVAGVNDDLDHARELAAFLQEVSPATAYLGIPTRPPAEPWVQPPDAERINAIFQIISEKVADVEYLIGYEGNAFSSTGNVEEDLLSITSVHPMREDAVAEFLSRAGADWLVIRRLIEGKQLVESEYGGQKYYLRAIQ
jgi:wyosine [tRNA(Phe)-imidazoG37] synthetase (radical SAM superfamily)